MCYVSNLRKMEFQTRDPWELDLKKARKTTQNVTEYSRKKYVFNNRIL